MGEFEGRHTIHHQDGEWGTDSRDGVRTGVSECLPSVHPTATSTRCVDTSTYRCRTDILRSTGTRLFRGALGNEGVCSVGFWEDRDIG
jgi:hypothetical protein